MLKVTADKYNGLVIDTINLTYSPEEFESELLQLIKNSADKKLLWIKPELRQSHCIPVLVKHGFVFHHCNEQHLMMVKKLQSDAVVPVAKNYVAGVGAIVVHQGKLLVVRDRFMPGYKLPGGYIDYNESIRDALAREILEETGIVAELEAIVNIGHFPNGQFGESSLYLVCTAIAKTTEIVISDTAEILEASWIIPEEFLQSDLVNNYNKRAVESALKNKDRKLLPQNITLRVPNAEVFF